MSQAFGFLADSTRSVVVPNIEGTYLWWLGARKFGEDVPMFSPKCKRFAQEVSYVYCTD